MPDSSGFLRRASVSPAGLRWIVVAGGALAVLAAVVVTWYASARRPADRLPPPSQGAARPAERQRAGPDSAPGIALHIRQVERLQRRFNPTAGETATIRFSLSKPARVTLTVYGPSRELIATVLDGASRAAGLNAVAWDGRDRDGAIVPDEAYSFVVRAIAGAETDLWDPRLFSGGERVTAADLRTLDGNRFTYQIPKAARVLVRAAVADGPLVRTLVNWEPRPPGLATEQWDGMDAGGLRRISEIPNIRIGVMAFALPEKSILTTGNAALDYRTFYAEVGVNLPHEPVTPRVKTPQTVISPHWYLPPHLNRDPRLALTLVGVDDRQAIEQGRSSAAASRPTASGPSTMPAGITEVRTRDTLLVRVDIPDAVERDFMNQQKFELIISVDDRWVLEVEQGHVPFTYPWVLAGLAPGRHMLTINVATFRNHVGTVSRIVDVKP